MSWGMDVSEELQALQKELYEKSQKLAELWQKQTPEPVTKEYTFTGPDGTVTLAELFGDGSDLIVVHNMGQSCSYCTMWADGFNGLYDHLADRCAFVVTSSDEVEAQQAFASARGWRFPVYSARGTGFAEDMRFGKGDAELYPGCSTFHKAEDGSITRVGSTPFGPGDSFNAGWQFFALLKKGSDGWQPKLSY